MERSFHDWFYRPYPDISIANLMNGYQRADESVTKYMEQFRKLKSRCPVQFPEAEYAHMVIKNMHSQIADKLIGQEYHELSQLAVKASRIESFIKEKEAKRSDQTGRGPHLISIIDDEGIGEGTEEPYGDVMAAELVQGKPYTCQALRPPTGKEPENREEYLFYITRTDRSLMVFIEISRYGCRAVTRSPPPRNLRGRSTAGGIIHIAMSRLVASSSAMLSNVAFKKDG